MVPVIERLVPVTPQTYPQTSFDAAAAGNSSEVIEFVVMVLVIL
jgi:hypothetical protein